MFPANVPNSPATASNQSHSLARQETHREWERERERERERSNLIAAVVNNRTISWLGFKQNGFMGGGGGEPELRGCERTDGWTDKEVHRGSLTPKKERD